MAFLNREAEMLQAEEANGIGEEDKEGLDFSERPDENAESLQTEIEGLVLNQDRIGVKTGS